jgi:hypothetical protein
LDTASVSPGSGLGAPDRPVRAETDAGAHPRGPKAASGARRRKIGPAEVTGARQFLDKGEVNADDVAGMLK